MVSKQISILALCLLMLLPAKSIALSQAKLPTVCFHDCKLDSAGFVLIKTAEGYSPFVYKDSVGIDTIGFGHVVRPGEKIKAPLMGSEAVALLDKDIQTRTEKLNKIIKVPLTINQFDALTSFAYNVGVPTLQKSTLLKKVNAEQHDQVHNQFLRYDRAGDRVIRGLRLRREAEATLYDDDLLVEE